MLALACTALACASDADSSTAGVDTAGSSAAGASAGRDAAPAAGGSGNSGVGVGSAGARAADCPGLRPVEDSVCPASASVCSYDEIECACATGSWSCSEPVDPNCPATMPAHGSTCSVPEATECEFLGDECECAGGLWTCESAEAEDAGVPAPMPTPAADAGAPVAPADSGTSATQCPDLRPIEGLSCTMSAMSCAYDTTVCQCPRGMWLCNESVDPTCPIEPPRDGASCTGRADCDYLDIECECVADTWSCKMND
jgi:hypothetical protein